MSVASNSSASGSTDIPFQLKGSFFDDPVFSDCWEVIERQRSKRRVRAETDDGQTSATQDEEIYSRSPVVLANHFKANCDRKLKVEKGNYHVVLDVQQFSASEIYIKLNLDEDNRSNIIVEGRHEEKNDATHGFISRQFIRKYKMPKDGVASSIQCNLSSDGILEIVVPRQGETAAAGGVDISGGGSTLALPSPRGSRSPGSPGSILNKFSSWDNFLDALPDFHMTPFFDRITGRNKKTQFGVQSDMEFFKILIDTSEFRPEEIQVRHSNYYVIIEGQHEPKDDEYGSISRHFTQKFDLPKSVVLEDLECNMLPDGAMEIKAAKIAGGDGLEREVPVYSQDNHVVFPG